MNMDVYTNYSTNTVGTLRRNYMKKSIVMWEQRRKKGWFHDLVDLSIFKTKSSLFSNHPALFLLQTQSAREVLPCALTREFHRWNLCAKGCVGFLIDSMHTHTHIHTHTHTHTHTHLSHQPGNSPVSCHCGLWVAKQRRLLLGSITESHLCSCGVCSWGDEAEFFVATQQNCK